MDAAPHFGMLELNQIVARLQMRVICQSLQVWIGGTQCSAVESARRALLWRDVVD
jgi:hypothetical protein